MEPKEGLATKIIGPLIVLALLLLLYFPTFLWLVNSWLHSPYYSHGFLIPPVAGVIAWTRRSVLAKNAPSQGTIPVLLAGMALYAGGFLYASDFLAAMSLLVVLAGLVLYFWGNRVLIAFAFPLGFLAFMIPFPFLDRLSLWMQSFAAYSSAWIIGLMGIPITRTGAMLQLENAAFIVGLPCSGMKGLIALLALAALFAYILKGPFPRKVLLFALAFPVAILANLLRLVALLVIGDQWGADAAMTFFHDFFSPIFFGVSILCLILLARLLQLRFGEAHG
jgi:exosortase